MNEGRACSGAKASTSAHTLWKWSLIVIILAVDACAARHPNAAELACPVAKTVESRVPRVKAEAPEDAGADPPLGRMYVAVEGRCTEWSIQGGFARYRRATRLGDVVLEVRLDPSLPSPHWGKAYRRIGPLEAIQDRLEELNCVECFQDRDSTESPPWQDRQAYGTARWYATEAECQNASRRAITDGTIALESGGRDFSHGVLGELTEEGMRLGEAEDSREYEAARRRLQAVEDQGRARLRLFQSVLSRTLRIFVPGRESGSGAPKCETWGVHQDPGSPSGWIYREEKIEGERMLFEFRFAAHPDSTELTGWISTFLPSSAEERFDVVRGSLCTATTTLVDMSAVRAKFSDQTWYFVRSACQAASRTADEDRGELGPHCDRMGRGGE